MTAIDCDPRSTSFGWAWAPAYDNQLDDGTLGGSIICNTWGA